MGDNMFCEYILRPTLEMEIQDKENPKIIADIEIGWAIYKYEDKTQVKRPYICVIKRKENEWSKCSCSEFNTKEEIDKLIEGLILLREEW